MAALALLLLAVLLLRVVAPLLSRWRVFDRAPNLGVLAWQVLVVSALLSIVLGGLVLLVPTMPVATSVAEFLEACVLIIQQRYASPAGALLAVLGAAIAVTVVLRGGYHGTRALVLGWWHRRRHGAKLAVAGRPGPDDVTILDHPTASAYCLPGRQRQIVLTSEALETLTSQQCRAVLAHERAHLRGRHHLVLTSAGAVAAAFPFVHAFQTARAEIARLIELAADDAAVRTTDRFTLAEALLTLASGSSPTATLAAGGSTAAARVRRLISAPSPLRPLPALASLVITLSVLALPMILAAGPAASAIGADHCPLGPITWIDQLTVLLP